jgi:hypothetical protein
MALVASAIIQLFLMFMKLFAISLISHILASSYVVKSASNEHIARWRNAKAGASFVRLAVNKQGSMMETVTH